MKTKSCKKCSPLGKRCDCPTESEKAALGPWEVIDRIRCERDEIRAQLREEQQLHIQTLNERDELRRTNEGLQLTFDLRWQADRRAIKRWQAAHPGNDLTWPDHADMVVWLMERYNPARCSRDMPALDSSAEQ